MTGNGPAATAPLHRLEPSLKSQSNISSFCRPSALIDAARDGEPSLKRMKIEASQEPVTSPHHQINGSVQGTTKDLGISTTQQQSVMKSSALPENVGATSTTVINTKKPVETLLPAKCRLAAASEGAPAQTSTTPAQEASVATNGLTSAELERPPLKSTTMTHLKIKYTGELEYMLREFRKLERQLLGARGAAQMEETAGSRERREKLHSFILHLEDTLRQIEIGCEQEAQGKSTTMVAASATEAGTEEPKKQTIVHEKEEEEENVQKLEEHILANLLPVKVRLKKQLAAQKGATRNPAGMPATRRGMLQPSDADRGKGTFAAAAEQRRKQAEASMLAGKQTAEPLKTDQTQYAKPLSGGGSSLTQKLHGQSMPKARKPGHEVVANVNPSEKESPPNPKVLYAGVAIGSPQIVSGVNRASQVHEMVISSPATILAAQAEAQPSTDASVHSVSHQTSVVHHTHEKVSVQIPKVTPAATTQVVTHSITQAPTPAITQAPTPAMIQAPTQTLPKLNPLQNLKQKLPTPAPAFVHAARKEPEKKHDDPSLTEEQRKKLRRKRKKRKLRRKARRREMERQRQLVLHQQAVQAAQMPTKGSTGRKKTVMGKVSGKKRGPRTVEYICALCSEAYNSTCEFNPWWALAQHECPKCRKTQIPRVDISAPANTIEYHPALLAHADENASNSGGGHTTNNVAMIQVNPVINSAATAHLAHQKYEISDSDSDCSDISDGHLSDCSSDSDNSDAEALASMSAAERAENERFGAEYKGPTLPDYDAARLLILMAHASTCPCRHKSSKHRDICRSTKYLMLHVRDCPGTTSTFDVCPFPWCRKVKHLLFHLVSCTSPTQCNICSPPGLSSNFSQLVGLNNFRFQKRRERILAAGKPVATTRAQGNPLARANHPGQHMHVVTRVGQHKKGHVASSILPSGKSIQVQHNVATSSILPNAKSVQHKAAYVVSTGAKVVNPIANTTAPQAYALPQINSSIAPVQAVAKSKPLTTQVIHPGAIHPGTVNPLATHTVVTQAATTSTAVIPPVKQTSLPSASTVGVTKSLAVASVVTPTVAVATSKVPSTPAPQQAPIKSQPVVSALQTASSASARMIQASNNVAVHPDVVVSNASRVAAHPSTAAPGNASVQLTNSTMPAPIVLPAQTTNYIAPALECGTVGSAVVTKAKNVLQASVATNNKVEIAVARAAQIQATVPSSTDKVSLLTKDHSNSIATTFVPRNGTGVAVKQEPPTDAAVVPVATAPASSTITARTASTTASGTTVSAPSLPVIVNKTHITSVLNGSTVPSEAIQQVSQPTTVQTLNIIVQEAAKEQENLNVVEQSSTGTEISTATQENSSLHPPNPLAVGASGSSVHEGVATFKSPIVPVNGEVVVKVEQSTLEPINPSAMSVKDREVAIEESVTASTNPGTDPSIVHSLTDLDPVSCINTGKLHLAASHANGKTPVVPRNSTQSLEAQFRTTPNPLQHSTDLSAPVKTPLPAAQHNIKSTSNQEDLPAIPELEGTVVCAESQVDVVGNANKANKE